MLIYTLFVEKAQAPLPCEWKLVFEVESYCLQMRSDSMDMEGLSGLVPPSPPAKFPTSFISIFCTNLDDLYNI